jgi:hypothetical protein
LFCWLFLFVGASIGAWLVTPVTSQQSMGDYISPKMECVFRFRAKKQRNFVCFSEFFLGEHVFLLLIGAKEDEIKQYLTLYANTVYV